MSVIMKNNQGEIVLYCKGADSIIKERMKENNPHIGSTWEKLESYGNIGLRTLLLSKRVIPESEYEIWKKNYHEASTAMNNREEKVMEEQEKIEKQMELVGATAIEDKLQDEVGPTIKILKDAGISVWVLTGDKIETAINIGFSCQLLDEHLERLIVDGETPQEVLQSLESTENQIKMLNGDVEIALIMSGNALITIMKEKELQSRVMKIAEKAKAVLACRVSPKQKQEVVSLVREVKPNVVTLAIGDGANDVNMITAAHVGIGIKGVEGQQAARASDYAIGEFKLLRRLILYTGRESYRKNSYLILYNFFKNMVLVLPHFWFAFLNGFSGLLLYDPWLYQCFNLFYTALPIIIYALVDEEYQSESWLNIFNYPKNYLENHPEEYALGQKSQIFNSTQFWIWMFDGAWNACICTYFTDGRQGYFFLCGIMIFTLAVLIGNFKIFIFSNTFYPFSLFIIVGSIIFYFLNQIFFGLVETADAYNTFKTHFSTANFYFGVILICCMTMFAEVAKYRFLRFLKEGKKETEAPYIKKNTKDGDRLISNTGFALNIEEPITEIQKSQYKN